MDVIVGVFVIVAVPVGVFVIVPVAVGVPVSEGVNVYDWKGVAEAISPGLNNSSMAVSQSNPSLFSKCQ